MKTLAEYRSEADSLLQDAAGDLVSDDRDKAIAHAVARYSRLRPREIVADIAGNGGSDYAPPSGWIEGFSNIESIEFPIGDVPATLLEDEDFGIYRTTSAEKIRLNSEKPTASQSFRVIFNGLHSVTEAAGTINDADFSAVCHLAAAAGCRMLANKYAQLTEPTLQADAVDHKSKAFEFSQRARDLEKVFNDHLGVKTDAEIGAGMAFKDQDVNFPWGEDRLTHPRRWR